MISYSEYLRPVNNIYESMKPHEVFIIQYNTDIVDIYSNLKQAYYHLEGMLSGQEKWGFRSYEQVTRYFKEMERFYYTPKPHKSYSISRYPVQKTYQ